MKVFISYSHADKKIVECLVTALRVIGIEVWYDENITVGDSILGAIQKNISSSFCFIPILSSRSLSDSTWCKTELNAAFHIINGRQSQSSLEKIIPVYIEKCSSTQIPPFLLDIRHIDLYRVVECESVSQKLIAAISNKELDLTSKEYKSAIQKLVAAISNKPTIHIYNYQIANQSESEDSPYLLKTLEPNDGAFFNKRGVFLEDRKKLLGLINKDRKKNFITIEGESGSGKSSLVMAGIIPALAESGGWKFGYCKFDTNPFEEIAWMFVSILKDVKYDKPHEIADEVDALAIKLKENKNGFDTIFSELLKVVDKTSMLLLVADQLESLYSKCTPEIRTNFLEKLKNCLDKDEFKRITLITTFDPINIITDGEDIDSDYENFIKASSEKLTELSDPELIKLIENPAKQKGIEIKNDLTQKIIKDLNTNRNDLMFLGAVLDNLWDVIKNENLKIVTIDHYEAYRKREGNNALNIYANKVFNSSIFENNGERESAKRLILSMVYGVDLDQRIITKNKIIEPEKYGEIIAKLSRIIKISDKRDVNKIEIEFAHKKIAENWSELRKWVKKEKRNLDVARSLEFDAREWNEKYTRFWNLKDWSFLHVGRRLANERKFYKKNEILIDDENTVAQFLDRSTSVFWFFISVLIIEIAMVIGLISKLSLDYMRDKERIETEAAIKMDEIKTQTKEEIKEIQIKSALNEIKGRISYGEQELLNYTDFDKSNGILRYAQGEFEAARQFFGEALLSDKNDPEALIYLNNARVSEWEKQYGAAYSIATSVPARKNTEIALEILRGVAQAQDNLNSECLENKLEDDERKKKFKQNCDSGIKGKPLKIMIIADENDKTIASNIAEHLVKTKTEILAVVGHNASEVSSEAAIEYQKGELVMVSPNSFALKFNELDNEFPDRSSRANYIFAVAFSHEILIQKIVDKMRDNLDGDTPKVLLCFDRTSFDQDAFAKSFGKAANNDEIKLFGINSGKNSTNSDSESDICDFSKPNVEFSKHLKDMIKEHGVNTIFLASHVNKIQDSIAVLKKIRNTEEFSDIQLFGSPTLYTNQTLEFGKKLENKLEIAVGWFPPDINVESESESVKFYDKAKELWNDPVGKGITWRTATAFDTTNVIITGLKSSEETSRQSLQKKLAENDFELQGATGLIKFFSDCTKQNNPIVECSLGKRMVDESPDLVTLIEIKRAEPPEGFEYYEFSKIQ